ncbi:hypothetical protein AbraIFM66951_001079 [Aspergillus brasiliensis]|uniref:Uncharacterized protein n=1 Tax=Aspergillus brasiliensis TaxID=319629 RepID=A0A9W6DK76_9EURO|nr:hypothetical protein AbraCBS73388_010116 [Aspergillus brasiliensis]GKZ48837.1 hypothetical protein AbraIFM66951_001079 [Aspergillus brasiliensis]
MAVDPSVVTPWFGPQQAAAYFPSLLSEGVSQTQVLSTNQYLLQCVHDGEITPKIFAVWLFLAHSKFPCVLGDALRDENSRGVRKAGIDVLKCAMRTDDWWEKGWDAVGGAAGLKEIFEKLSIREARSLARAIGSCSNTSDPVKRQAIYDLLRLLVPNFFDSSPSHESRQLLRMEDVMPLFNLSGEATLITLVSTPLSNDFMVFLIRQMLVSRVPLLREIAIGSVPAHSSFRKRLLDDHLTDLLTSPEAYEPQIGQGREAIFAAMDFTLDLLHSDSHVSEKARVVDWKTQARCIDVTLTTARRRNMSSDAIIAFLEQALPLMGHAERKISDWTPLIYELIELWVIAAFPEAHLESVSDAPAARYREQVHPSRPRPVHKDYLESVLRTVLSSLSSEQFEPCLNLLLPKTVAKAKLPLFKIICKECRKIDLDQPTPSEKEQQLLPWKSSFILSLPGRDARWLFERAELVSPKESPVKSFAFEWPTSAGDSASFRDSLFRVHFEAVNREQPDHAKSIAHELIEDVKRKAVKARDPGDRLQWAKLTITNATMSRNLRLLKEAIFWTPRFLRDPFVRPGLALRIYREDVASILSCVTSPTLEALAADVHMADEVISHLLEQALLVTQEPWYKSPQDRNFGRLLRLVVSSRVHAAKGLCYRGLGSEQDVVGTLFEGIIPILLRYETLGGSEGYDLLGWGALSGPLTDMQCPLKPPPSILRLFDSLGQQRDHLWAKQRLLRSPQTASLPEGLPRGLPLQYLLPSPAWTIAVIKHQGLSGFVKKRVTEIVFSDPAVLLQKVKEDDKDLEPLVDSLTFAIKVYLGQWPVHERGPRILEIWRHYSERIPSSAGHLAIFKKYMYSLLGSRRLRKLARIIDPPQLPSLEIFKNMSHDSPSLEWEPRSEIKRESAQGCWKGTLLQRRFLAHKVDRCLDMILVYSHPHISWSSPEKPKAFDLWRPKHSPWIFSCQYRESLIASAMLFLNSLARNTDRILSKPFPENTQILRYPPVHLDYDFLSTIDDQTEAATAAMSLLARLVRIVPPSLLYDLSLSLLDTLHVLPSAAPKYGLVQRFAFETMALVRRSDRPELAATLGLKALELFPEASSWHRMAFPSSLAKVLSRSDRERVVHDFTAYVFKSLEEQKQPTSSDAGGVGSGETIIKITTVKMLATMLAESISGVSTTVSVVEALKDLFHASNHIDVRVTVCTALLDIIDKYHDSERAYEIFISFTPYAAVPSESSASGSWLEPGNAKLPRIEYERPLLDLFVSQACLKLPSKYHEHYTYKALLPLLDESTRQHNIWMRRFLAQVDLSPEEQSVTDFGPFAHDMIHRMMECWSEYLPREFLLRYRSWILSYLDCIRLRNIADKLAAKDRLWRTRDSGSHWNLWFYHHAKMKSLHVAFAGIQMKTPPEVANGITHEDLTDEIVICAEAFLRNPFNLAGHQVHVSLDRITNLLSTLGINQPFRRTELLPIAERIIAFAQGLRTEEWMNDPHRSPPVLPSRLQLEALLLPFPQFHKESPYRYTRFVSSTLSLVEECVRLDTYVADIPTLREAMNCVRKEDARECALGFGQRYEASTSPLVQYVRVWLAQILVLKCDMHIDDSDSTGRAMMLEWRKSLNESIRSIGWSTYPDAL